jgi:hypothetical protein
MHENLQKMGIESSISKQPDPKADINHHIFHASYNGEKSSIDTVFITHIDKYSGFEKLKDKLQNAAVGICMSKHTQIYLVKMGLNKNKLCYINPAHDSVIPIKKIIIGLASNVYDDGRKNEVYIDRFIKKIDSKYFKFIIMGTGWEAQVSNLKGNGFETNYYNHFDYNEYIKLIPSLDYYLYMGTDEGQMGWVDALVAGVKTIVTPQGYHLDIPNGITHPFVSYNELEDILLMLQNSKKMLTQPVASWTWYNYTLKHVELWKYLLGENQKPSNFDDGLNSLINIQRECFNVDNKFIKRQKKILQINEFKQTLMKLKYIYKGKGIRHLIYRIVKKIDSKIKGKNLEIKTNS